MFAKSFIAIWMIAVILVGAGIVLLSELTTQEKLVLEKIKFSEDLDYIFVECRNAGTTDIIINEMLVNARPIYDFKDWIGVWIPAGESTSFGCAYEWESEYSYRITVATSRGNIFSKTGHAPKRHIPLLVDVTIWNFTDSTISIVVENIDMRPQNITGLVILSSGSFHGRNVKYSEINCNLNISASNEWDWWIAIPSDYTATLILHWPYRDPWTSGKTYFFRIWVEDGPDVDFNSKAT